jgi:putative cardiolipin synthase
MMNLLRQSCLIVILAALCGCATVDFNYPKTISRAPIDTDDTHFGRRLEGLARKHPGKAGFYPIVDGIESLAARLLMAERAERTIDVQYYLIIDDVIGYVFIDSLLRAADRGVRVRLLLDDFFTMGYDAGLAALDSHPNFEVRIFNPFAQRSARAMDGVTSYSRINRRMHNKSLTVDNKITLIGGRNIAAEYFGISREKDFGDLDVSCIGPVVSEVSDMFDAYWNSITAAPVPAFTKMPEDLAAELLALRGRIEQSNQKILDTPYAAAVKMQVHEFIGSDEDLYTWAPYTLAYDSPDKAQEKLAENAQSIRTPLRESLTNAQEEIVIISPYFVPNETLVQGLIEMQKRGIDVTIVTNSLAANNQLAVHSGYVPSRKPLLKEGIKIYEVRPDATVRGSHFVAASGAISTLHTKAFAVDRRELFIGSFNFDPRSAYINTELGVIIESPELAAPLVKRLFEKVPTHAYEVFLNERGRLRWRGIENGQEVILDKEPQTTWWQRFVVGFLRILPIKSQL